MADLLTLPVQRVIAPNPHLRILHLDLEGRPFHFRAGQLAFIGRHGQPQRRPYSIACAPEQAARTGSLEFLLKVDHGGVGPHLGGLRKHMRVDVQGPLGSFGLPADTAGGSFLFVAGGTGIAPLRSMLWHLLLTGRGGAIGVAYSARSPRHFAFTSELRALAHEGRIRLMLTATRDAARSWRGDRGRVDRRRLAALAGDPATYCYVCGPPSLLDSVPPILRDLGVAAAHIRMEEW